MKSLSERIILFANIVIKMCWKQLVLIITGILVIVWICAREKKIAGQAGDLARMDHKIAFIEVQRDNLAGENDILKEENRKITASNDSMEYIIACNNRDISDMKIRHRYEIDSLLAVPDDTVYVRLQPIFPNYNGSPLIYRFSNCQIRSIYCMAVSYPRLEAEFALQGSNLNTCLSLNDGYRESIDNLGGQVENLEKSVLLANDEIDIFRDKDILQAKQLRKEKGRKRIWQVVSVVSVAFAVFK